MKLFARGWSDHRDGPGHRRIYYLKGCNLACRWCASPESICREDQLLFYPDRAREGKLDFLCPHGAIRGTELNRRQCRVCGDFACRSLRHPALEWAGFDWSGEELLRDIAASRSWGDFSGATFGGGEPSLQAEELLPVLQELKALGVHTAMESNATVPAFRELVPELDLVIADLKAGTEQIFREWTGGDLAAVHANLAFAAEQANGLIVRIPFITGCNTSAPERTAMAEFLAALRSPLRVEVLPLHHFGGPGYRALNLPYPLEGVVPPPESEIADFENELKRHGLSVERS